MERRIRDEAVEWLYVFDRVGTQIARFRGTEEAVDFSDELKGASGGLYGTPVLSGHLFVHNHPVRFEGRSVVDFPPSPSDLLTAIERDLRAFVVVSGRRRYLLSRPGTNWPSDEHLMLNLIRFLEREFNRTIDGDLDSLLMRIQRQRFVLEHLSHEGWIGYEQTIHSGDP